MWAFTSMFSHKTCPRTQKRYITGRPPGGRHNLMQKVEPHIVEVEPRSQRQCHYVNIQFFSLPNCANNGYNLEAFKLKLTFKGSPLHVGEVQHLGTESAISSLIMP